METGVTSQDKRNAMAASRLALVQQEIGRRQATGEKFGFALPGWMDPAEASAHASLLVVAADADERKRLQSALGSIGTVTVAAHAPAGEAAFATGRFDAAVIAAAPETARELCESARGSDAGRAMPIVLIGDNDNAPMPSQATDILHRPWRAPDLCTRLRLLIGRARYDQAVRQSVQRATAPVAIDALTGLFSHSFLHDHLNGQIADAADGRHSLSVGWLAVEGLEYINEDSGYAAGDRLLQQVGLLVGHLTRTEDLAARHGGACFCVTLFDTDLAGARTMVARLAGIIGHTQFAVADLAEPVTVGIRTGTATLCPGDRANTLIARAAEDGRHRL